MERLILVQLDTEYLPQTCRVRTSWGGLTMGSLIEVQFDGDSVAPKWVRCRIERRMSGRLLVSRA